MSNINGNPPESYETQEVAFLTKKQVCKLLQISPRTLDLWRSQNGLPTVKIGNVCRFRQADVLDWFMNFEQRNKVGE